jgi:hypothetical protein
MKKLVVVCLAALVVSCGKLTTQGTGSSYLIVESLEASSGGGEEDSFGGDLESDVLTVVNGSGAIFQDVGRVTFALGMKDPGSAGSPNAPSPNNFITIDRYRVRYIRADGRNTPGVDVPYGFDGAFTVTVAERATVTFALVRAQAKAEAPLAALANNLVVLSTIAEITFYGHDQTGREVSAVARINVHFGNWADPS